MGTATTHSEGSGFPTGDAKAASRPDKDRDLRNAFGTCHAIPKLMFLGLSARRLCLQTCRLPKNVHGLCTLNHHRGEKTSQPLKALSVRPAAAVFDFAMPLDKDAFKESIQVLALRIPKQKCNAMMKKFRG